MRQFVIKILLSIVIFNACCWIGEPFFIQSQGNSNIYDAISLISSNTEAHKIILGDSVGEQIYPESKSSKPLVLCATTNRAIGLVGQLILLKHFLNTRSTEKVNNVHIVMHPGSFGARLDEKFTFNYFLQPFRRHIQELEIPKHISSQINPPLLMVTMQLFPAARIVPYDIFSGNSGVPPMRSNPEIMDYSDWAMNQLDSIAGNGVNIHFHCAPLQSNWQDSTFSNLNAYFDTFTNLTFHNSDSDMIFMNRESFREGIHFNSTGLRELGKDPLNLLH